MDLFEQNLRLRLQNDLRFYAKRTLKIATKEGGLTNFVFNPAQVYVNDQLNIQKTRIGRVRAVILKGRQLGCSTLVAARYYHQVTHRHGCQAFIMAHEANATNNLYEIARRYHEHTDDLVKPEILRSNAKELKFAGLDSGYKLGTAENEKVGRSSTIHLLHGSEVAFWSNTIEHTAGVMQAVPDSPNTEIILESTANGVGGYFFEMWQDAEAGLSDYIAIFVPWFWQEEYSREPDADFRKTPDEEDLVRQYGLTDAQVNWRRYKILDLGKNGANGTLRFQQEYPNCASEAFIISGDDNFIPSSLVIAARKNTIHDRYGATILGVDPARFGQDRTTFIRRQGRVAYNFESYSKWDLMQTVGRIVTILENEDIDRVCIDVGGVGAGVVDRLREVIDPKMIYPVNFGSKPFEESKYLNKRAEMWAQMKLWFEDLAGCQVVDSDELQSDLINVKYTIDSNSRLKLEAKDQMKKRGVRSPDGGDALALTFALPKTYFAANLKVNQGLDSLAEHSSRKRQLQDQANYRNI